MNDKRVAMTLTGLSVFLLAMMIIREGKELLADQKPKSWVERERERPQHNGRSH